MPLTSRSIKIWLLLAVTAVAVVVLIVYRGVFDVAADAPHSPPVSKLLELVRDRSIAVRIEQIQVPPLDDAQLVAAGAGHYDAMCVGCHLAPDEKSSELRAGLYPQPPDLTKDSDVVPAAQFWVIKHGIKMSAMPAWGKTHDDPSIWGIVAFLQRLPQLTPEQYRALVEPAEKAAEHTHEHGQHHEH